MHGSMEIMGENEAAQVRNSHDVTVRLGLLVGDRKQIELDVAMGIPDGLDRRQLRWLVLERVEAMRVAEEELQRNQYGQEPQRHRQHRARLFDKTRAPQ